MGFEKFEAGGQGRGGGSEPMISLRKSGSIGINQAALDEFFEEDDEAVVMYYDEEEKQVGLEPVKDKDEDNAYTLTRSDSGGAVAPRAFLRTHDLIPDVTQQFHPETVKVNQNLELIAFQTDQVVRTYGSPDEEEESEEAEA